MAPDESRPPNDDGEDTPREPAPDEPGAEQTDPWGFLRVGGDPVSADTGSGEEEPAAELPEEPEEEEPEVPEEPAEPPEVDEEPGQGPEASQESSGGTEEWDIDSALEVEDSEGGDSEAWEALEAEYREELAPEAAEQADAEQPEPEGEGPQPEEREAVGPEESEQSEESEKSEEEEPDQEGGEPAEEAAVATADAEQPYEVDPTISPAEGGLPPGMFIPPGWERDYLEPDAESEKPRRRGLALRFTAASLLIVASFAAATAISILNYLGDIASALGQNSGLKGVRQQLISVGGGEPQTILLLGSDERKVDRKNGYPSRSDTAILLRLDPDKDAIALLSLPRDLKVNIPGRGTDKLNAAYSYGGPKLTLRTVKQLTGLNINHLVNVNFNGFLQATYAIDCVYVDVDRRYYVPPGAGFAEIDLKPGYQRLCGSDALSYVRYRHTDSDLVRGARQQDFLREARSRIGAERLIQERKELIRIFTRYTTSDIDDPETMLEVMKLMLASRGSPIKEVHFKGRIGPSFVFATPAQIRSAVRQFLGVEASSGPRGELAGQDAQPKPTAEQKRKQAKKRKKQKSRRKTVLSSGLQASTFGRELAQPFRNRFEFPLYYPTRIVPGAIYAQKPRGYFIRGDTKKDHFGAMKWTFRSGLGEYYGIMETSWSDPPILSHPSETRKIGKRSYDLHYDNDRLRLVSWQDGSGTYWVTNTLLQTLTEQQMLGLATSMKVLRSRSG